MGTRIPQRAMRDGEIRFRDLRADPAVDPSAREVEFRADNLVRSGAGDSAHRAEWTARGRFQGSGRFVMRMRMDPEARRPGFVMDLALRGLDMGGPSEKDPGLGGALKEGAAQLAGDLLEAFSEERKSKGEKPPGFSFSGRFPERAQNAWSMSGYVLRESFRTALHDGKGGGEEKADESGDAKAD